MTIPDVVSGQPITAEWGNAIRDAIVAASVTVPFELIDAADYHGTDELHWIPGQLLTARALSGTYTNGCLHYAPFRTSLPFSVSGVRVRVSSAGSSGSARLGLVSADENYEPVELVYDFGPVAINSTGTRNVAITPEEFPAGRYLSAIIPDSACGLSIVAIATPHTSGMTSESLRSVRTGSGYTSAAFPDPLPSPSAANSHTPAGLPHSLYYRP